MALNVPSSDRGGRGENRRGGKTALARSYDFEPVLSAVATERNLSQKRVSTLRQHVRQKLNAGAYANADALRTAMLNFDDF